MRTVVLESPYAGDVDANVEYGFRAILDCLSKGEAPIASHLLYTEVLNDEIEGERKLGIEAGHAWIHKADCVVFYLDRGMSNGMVMALERAAFFEVPCEFRYLERG